MVAMSDYNDFHKMAKRYILANVLGANAQVVLYFFLFPFFSFWIILIVCSVSLFRRDTDRGETP